MVLRPGSLRLKVLVLSMLALIYLVVGASAVEIKMSENKVGSEGDQTMRLSQEALESIAGLDDHPVEDDDESRADRMLSALERIPDDDRLDMGLDLKDLRTTPLAERLVKLETLWTERQHELKEAYEAMPKVNEVLTKRIDILEDSAASESSLLAALTELENMLSDIDMARDFHTLDGLPVLVSMLHVSQPEIIREAAAWALGTAVKNEPEHQRWVLEGTGEGQPFALKLLLDNAAVANSLGLRMKLVYALSACLSNNNHVQLQFGSLRGEEKLSALYDANGSESRLKTKILTLLSDLLQEAARGSPAAILATMPIGATPTSGGVWCERVDTALQEASSGVALEKALEAVASFAPSCRDHFTALGTKQRLGSLAQQCRSTSSTNGDGWVETEFQEELAQMLEEAANALR